MSLDAIAAASSDGARSADLTPLARTAEEHFYLAMLLTRDTLYPVITVLLALVVDRELLRPTQYGAIGLAALSLVLIHAGG
jgi:hypothetical protein